MMLYIISGWEELALYCINGGRFMHFHYPSFLLGLLLGIILIVLLIYLLFWWLDKEDEKWFRRQGLWDDYADEDDSPK
jgi:hypothetical protein